MKWIWLFAINLLVVCSLGCSGQPKKEADLTLLRGEQDNVIAEFEKANAALDGRDYAEAAVLYDQLLVKYPTNQLDLLILFNSGIAHLQNLNCSEASERFRRLIRQTGKNSPTLLARAQLRMSDVYTCLGEDSKAITNLIELYRGKQNLPLEIAQAEVPAKLAGAYARIGNNKEAERYFRLAERGLIRVQLSTANAKDRQERLSILARTLFLMGSISQLNTETMEGGDYFATIRALQKYLFRAAEINDPIWSTQASEQLLQAYQNTWSYIDRVPPGADSDAAIAERARTAEKLRLAQTALISMQNLYAEHLPDPREPAGLALLMKRLKGEEIKLRNFIATNVIGTSLTPEALEREGLKRVGRTLNPDPILERDALRRSRPKKK